MTRRSNCLAACALLISSVAIGVTLGVTSTVVAGSSTNGLPLYTFSANGSGPLPWNASPAPDVSGAIMAGGPHAVSNALGETAVAFRTTNSSLDVLEYLANSQTLLIPLGSSLPAPGADPVPFFDPNNNVDLVYVGTNGDLDVAAPSTAPVSYYFHYTPSAWAPWTVTDLSALSGISVASGLASVQVVGSTAYVAARTTTNNIVIFTLAWASGALQPTLAGPPVNISVATFAGTSSSDPIMVSSPTEGVVSTTPSGDVQFFSPNPLSTSGWSEKDLTQLSGGAAVSGPLAATSYNGVLDVVGLGAAQHVELVTNGSTGVTSTTSTTTSTTGWSSADLTAATTNAPALNGNLYISATALGVTVAGQAANWGALFTLTSSSSGWTATNVSSTGGSAAETVGSVVTGATINGTPTLFAGGVDSPAPTGTGVYAIPSSDWSEAISNGWPILADTGGLGTKSAPWVGFTTASSVAQSPDYLMGQAIANSHKRTTWLSFWTVSGPSSSPSVSSFLSHGYAAGVWVAQQIDSYRGLGLGIKPDWVILDPEGYPDLHSGLDAPSGSSAATIATYATYWNAMLQGWAAGLDSVDPSLNAGFYASQSEYRNYGLSAQSLSGFVALAFGNGGPQPVAGASGSNVRGFIAFGATCTPTSSQPLTIAGEISELQNPPWSGSYNTVQFNSGVYCAP